MMTETAKKLSRAEACVELASRIWPNALDVIPKDKLLRLSVVSVWDTATDWRDFDPFTSRDAAIQLVRFIYSEASEGRASVQRFVQELEPKPRKDWVYARIITCMLATPEQITLAACAALGIEV